MAALSGQQRAEFATAATHQITHGVGACAYPQINTLELQLDAYYAVASLPGVRRVDTTFNRSSPHVVFLVHTMDSSVHMCFPCANAQRRMYNLTWIINEALSRTRQETSDAAEALKLCRAFAADLCAAYRKEPSWREVEQALQDGAKAVVWTPLQVVKLDFKPVVPGQFKRAFEQAGVSVCDDDKDEWNYELRLLCTHPSVYALGAADGKEHIWNANTNIMRLASQHVMEKANVRDTVKIAVIVYYE